MATAERIIPARSVSLCKICNSNILIGTMTAHRPGFGWVHHPDCFKVSMSPKEKTVDDSRKWEDEEGDEAESEAEAFKIGNLTRKGMGLAKPKAQSSEPVGFEELEAKLFEKFKQFAADQGRLTKGIVSTQLQESFAATVPELLKQITSHVKVATGELVKAKLEEARREFKGETQRAIQQIAGSGFVRQVIEIRKPDGAVNVLENEVFHPRFAWILKLATAGKPIFLPGPTGSGKTHIAMQVARAIYGAKWEENFGILSCSPATAERHFLGRSIPKITTGEEVYRSAEFVRIYENGGVFCLDEMDAGDPSVFIVINAALANGFLAVPDRTDNPIAHKHPNFVLIACANTYGRGADRKYVGRNPIDEATIDRFRMGTVPISYSAAVERAVCPNTDLYDLLTGWRNAIFTHKLERVLSTRFMKDAFEMVTHYEATVEDVTRALFSGWRQDEVLKVLGKELPEED